MDAQSRHRCGVRLLAVSLLLLLPAVSSLPAASSTPPDVPSAFLDEWGSEGGGDGQFYWPYGVAVDDTGNVYVADTSNHRLQKYDGSGTLLSMWGWGVQDGAAAFQICTSGCRKGTAGGGDRQFNTLSGVAVDALGNVYVADIGNDRIQKLDSSGVLISMWGWGVKDGTSTAQICTGGCQQGIAGSGAGQFQLPSGVAIDAAGDIFIADKDNHRVQKFAANGTYLNEWGSEGTSDGLFSYPNGVAVDAVGNVYVVDTNNHRIQKFESDGTFLLKWGTQGSGKEQLYWPHGAAVDASGDVYVADRNNNRIQKFDEKGRFLTQWGAYGSGDGEFNFPYGVAIDGTGHIYVVDAANHRIQKFGGPWLDVFVGDQPTPGALRGWLSEEGGR